MPGPVMGTPKSWGYRVISGLFPRNSPMVGLDVIFPVSLRTKATILAGVNPYTRTDGMGVHRMFKPFGLGMAMAGFLAALSGSAAMAQNPDFHIYLAFGQSNMEGGPQIANLTTPARFQVMQAVDCPRLSPARTKGSWYTANPPISRCTQGPGIAWWFGRTLVDSLPANVKIGIINVAVLGCKIELFDKDTYQAYAADAETWMTPVINEYGGSPYHRMVEVAKLAQKDGVIKGFLLHQGESNNGDQQWPDKVKGIYDDLMADLKLDPKQVPLLAGELVNADVNGAAAGHNTIIAKLPAVLPNSYVVSSKGLGAPTGDRLHFSAEGYKEFGKRYAATMLAARANLPSGSLAEAVSPGFSLDRELRLRKGGLTVGFAIPRNGFVSLKAYDVEGREIAELAGAEYPAGRHELTFDRTVLPVGYSFLRMESGGFTEARRMFLSPD